MKSFYEALRDDALRRDPDPAFFLNGPDQEIVLRWSKRHKANKALKETIFHASKSDLYCHYESCYIRDLPPPEDWEVTFYAIWFKCGLLCSMDEEKTYWDIAPTLDRQRYSEKVANLAKELANTLEADICPGYFVVSHYCEDIYYSRIENDKARKLSIEEDRQIALDKDPEFVKKWDARIEQEKRETYEYFSADTVEKQNAVDAFFEYHNDRERIDRHQSARGAGYDIDRNFPNILRSLAQAALDQAAEPRMDMRPNTGHPSARILARSLAKFFEEYFDKIPNDVIAACVCLSYPEIDPPPNEDVIRAWRGVK